MKIDEPNTPYNYYDEEADKDAQEDEAKDPKSPVAEPKLAVSELQEKLQLESEGQQSEEKKHADFAQKRKQHYNEYQQMQEWRKKHAEEEEV